MNPPGSARVFLRTQVEKPHRKRPSILARLLGMEVYSDRLLTQRTRIEMNLAARMLLMVALFELTAWSFLLNAIFSSDVYHYGKSTIAAVGMAALFASMIFWFERNVLTADAMSAAEARAAKTVRVIFILAAAFLTAQPVELLLFREPIMKRIHAEGIRRDALAKLNLLESFENYEARIAEQRLGSDVPSTEQAQNEQYIEEYRVRVIQGQLKEERAKYLSADENLRSNRANVEYWSNVDRGRREEVTTVENRLEQFTNPDGGEYERTSVDYQRAVKRHLEAEKELSAYREMVRKYTAAVEAIGESIKRLEQKEEEPTGKVKIRRTTLEEENAQGEKRVLKARQRLQRWIEKLINSKPQECVIEDVHLLDGSSKPYSYQDPEYDFFEQLGVLWDITGGKELRWPARSDAAIKRLQGEFGMGSQAEHRDGPVYLVSVVATHLTAAFVPFLIFSIKWYLMPKTLKNYYSELHQSFAGDLDAMLSVSVDNQASTSLADGAVIEENRYG